jgi:chitin disaccharide deacetylase
MTERRLVVFNADDFGLTDGVCRGIGEAVASGVVRATTAMVCVADSEERVRRWGSAVSGGVGIHLQLTEGRACLAPAAVSSIADASGSFPNSPAGLASADTSHVTAEWRAQIERLRSWGVEPSHMDSHHHVGLRRELVDTYVGVATAARLPARTTSPALTATLRARGVRCADLSVTSWYDGDLSARSLLRRIEAAFNRLHGHGALEIMCHPAFADAELAAKSKYVRQREAELGVLTSAKLAKGLRDLDVEVGSIASLAA